MLKGKVDITTIKELRAATYLSQSRVRLYERILMIEAEQLLQEMRRKEEMKVTVEELFK